MVYVLRIFFETETYSELEVHPISLARPFGNEHRDSPPCVLISVGVTGYTIAPIILSDLGSLACIACTIVTEPSLRPHVLLHKQSGLELFISMIS